MTSTACNLSLVHRVERNREAEKAEMIVAREAIRYHARAMAFDVAPASARLRATMEAIAQTEFRRAKSKLTMLTPDQQQATQLLLRGMTNKISPSGDPEPKAGRPAGDSETMETICALFDWLLFRRRRLEKMSQALLPTNQPDVLTA